MVSQVTVDLVTVAVAPTGLYSFLMLLQSRGFRFLKLLQSEFVLSAAFVQNARQETDSYGKNIPLQSAAVRPIQGVSRASSDPALRQDFSRHAGPVLCGQPLQPGAGHPG